MTVFKAILLGILQGATEFLPVSSSGHLLLAQKMLGLTEPELAFDILLHLGTLLAVLLFLRREISDILGSFSRRYPDLRPGAWGRRDLLLLVVSSVPTAIIGYAFHDAVETGVTFLGVGFRYLILTTFLLISNLRFRHKMDPDRIELWEAAAIGIMQGAAVFPGLSRSGSTISLALVLGIGASRSAKYSFFISLPAILGAALLHLHQGVSVLPRVLPSVLGFLFAFAVGYISLLFVERLVTRGRFLRFAPYTFLLAVLSFYLYGKG
ncbi:MAG: bacitracin resistance protein BacA, undecaprenyl-diphosphatase [Deltaproteobacteria bacterium CSP1-8]|nr:MAG: bacitracin resistance protein BacA, undecaprenyl-diphosphatase [Deltaproteobacteria bacterium CSP1-8]